MPDRGTCHVRGCEAAAAREFVGQPIFNFFVQWPVCAEHAHNLEAGDGYGIEGEDASEILLRHQWGRGSR